MHITLNSKHFDIEDFGEEIVLVNLETGVYFTVKGSGPVVMRAIQAGLEPTDMAEAVGPTWASAVESFIAQLLQEEILVAAEAEATAPTDFSGLSIEEAPVLEKFDDVSDLIKLDPIHDVSDLGWPHKN